MVWACIEKRRRIRRQESDVDAGGRGNKGEEDQRGGGWIASGTTCRSENCQGRTRNTGLNGGVSQHTSTPHKRGKKMRKKKKKKNTGNSRWYIVVSAISVFRLVDNILSSSLHC